MTTPVLHLSVPADDIRAHYAAHVDRVVLNFGFGAIHLDGPAARKLAAKLDSAADAAALASIPDPGGDRGK